MPVSLVRRRGVVADGSNPGLLYGYGSYEMSFDPYFSIARLSLLDREFRLGGSVKLYTNPDRSHAPQYQSKVEWLLGTDACYEIPKHDLHCFGIVPRRAMPETPRIDACFNELLAQLEAYTLPLYHSDMDASPPSPEISPLLSRSLLLTLEQLSEDDLADVIDRAVTAPHGLGDSVVLDPEARAAIIRLSSGDARRALTALEASALVATTSREGGETPHVTAEIVASAVDRALLRYDRQGDEHYDVISAFIKSVRGSDVDAALHYLARMIEAGEDPRFIARRVIISAAEDIGMADPQALVIAMAAADAVQLIGMPEGRIPLAEAVVYLATAPKSNAAYMALDAAIADVRAGKIGRVPKPLRDAHYPGAKRLGHGKGYKYSHDAEFGVAEQQYLPDELRGTEYYRPTTNGNEREVAARLEKLRAIIRGS